MSDQDRQDGTEELLSRLSQKAAVSQLVGLFFDFSMEQPLGRFIDSRRLLMHLDQALTTELINRVVDRHLRAWLDRELARTSDRQERLGDWVPEDVRSRLRALTSRPVHLKRPFVEALVAQDAVRHLLRSLVEETLTRFLDSLRQGKASGLVGAFARGAKGMASSMSRGVFGRLGAQIEAALERAADAFIEGSLDLLLRRTVDLLTSTEMARRLADLERAAFDAGLELSLHQAIQAVDRLPLDELVPLVPAVVAYNLARDGFRSMFLVQVEAVVESEGKRSLGEILSETKALGYWRDQMIEAATPLVIEFSKKDVFLQWLRTEV